MLWNAVVEELRIDGNVEHYIAGSYLVCILIDSNIFLVEACNIA